jgi:hypothetical protein
LTDSFDASPLDVAAVAALLGRPPAGRFHVVVRRPSGDPVVIRNAPSLEDGTPMPTLYWLVDRTLSRQVARLESEGAIGQLEREVDPVELRAAHDAYARERDALVVHGDGPVPTGGVGGTREGVKCLHAHLANFLASGLDPVGERVAASIELGELVPRPPGHDRLSR